MAIGKKIEKKVIIFDYDGTIVDSSKIIMKAYNEIAGKYGLKSLNGMSDLGSLYEKNVYDSILEKGLDKGKLDSFFKEWRDSFLDDSSDVRLINGIKEVILFLAGKNDIYIITSNSKKVILSLLERFGIKGIKEVFGGDEEKSKVVKINALRKGNKDREIFYVGDTVGDILEAKKAKVKSVAVTWGVHSRRQLEKVKPDFIVDETEELLGIFK